MYCNNIIGIGVLGHIIADVLYIRSGRRLSRTSATASSSITLQTDTRRGSREQTWTHA